MARHNLNFTAAELAALRDKGLVHLSYNGTGAEVPLADLVEYFSPARRLITSVVNVAATAGSQARDTVNYTVPAGEFLVGDIIHFKFKGKVTSASSTSNCTITGEVNAAGTPTTPVGVTSGTLVSTTSGLDVEFEAVVKWTSATAWATMVDGVAATPGSKVIASAHLIDFALAVAGATNVTATGIFTADLYRP